MALLISFLGSVFGKVVEGLSSQITVETAKFLAWRALVMFLMFIAFPVVLHNVLAKILLELVDYSLSAVSDTGVTSYTMQLTGMAAYIAYYIKLPEAFSIFMGFVAMRFTLGFLPGFK
jgi:hypothetical protein